MWKCSFVVIVCCALFLTLVHCLSLMWRLEFVFCFTHTAKMMTNVCIDKLLNRPSQTYDTSDEQHKWPETIQKRHTMLNNSHRRTRNWQNDQKLIKNKCKLSANRLKTNTKKKWGGRFSSLCSSWAHFLIICLRWWPSCLHPDFLKADAISVCAYTQLTLSQCHLLKTFVDGGERLGCDGVKLFKTRVWETSAHVLLHYT